MSLAPIGGKLREGTSGVDRLQAGYACWGDRPRRGDWSDLWLNVIMGHPATPNRSVVTAVKYVYSTWKFIRPGEKNGKTLYRNRSAPQSVHLLHSLGKRADVRSIQQHVTVRIRFHLVTSRSTRFCFWFGRLRSGSGIAEEKTLSESYFCLTSHRRRALSPYASAI